MKAISVRQPWAWAICHAGKRVENREWLKSPGLIGQAKALVGQRVAICAGLDRRRKTWDPAVHFMMSRSLAQSLAAPTMPRIPHREDIERGAVVAVVTLAAIVRTLPNGCRVSIDGQGYVCTLCRVLHIYVPCPKADPWAIPGTVGLILDDVRPLPRPVPFKGALGFFEVPDGAPCVER